MKAVNKRQSFIPAPKSSSQRSSALITVSSASSCVVDFDRHASATTCMTVEHSDKPQSAVSQSSSQNTSRNVMPCKIKSKLLRPSSSVTDVLDRVQGISHISENKHDFIDRNDENGLQLTSLKQQKNRAPDSSSGRLVSHSVSANTARKMDSGAVSKSADHTESKGILFGDVSKMNDECETSGNAIKSVNMNLSKGSNNKNHTTSLKLPGMSKPVKSNVYKQVNNNIQPVKQLPKFASVSETDFNDRSKYSPTKKRLSRGNKAPIKSDSADRKTDLLNEAGALHSIVKLDSLGSVCLQAYDLECYRDVHISSKKLAKPTGSSMSSPFGSSHAMPDLLAASSSHSFRKSGASSLDSFYHLDHLASSEGSLGILNDSDLLNSSLLPSAFIKETSSISCGSVPPGMFQSSTVESLSDLHVADNGEDSFVSLTNKIVSLSSRMSDASSISELHQKINEKCIDGIDSSEPISEVLVPSVDAGVIENCMIDMTDVFSNCPDSSSGLCLPLQIADCCQVTCESSASGLQQSARTCWDHLHAGDVVSIEPSSDARSVSESHHETPVVDEDTSRLTVVSEIIEDTAAASDEMQFASTATLALNRINKTAELAAHDVGESTGLSDSHCAASQMKPEHEALLPSDDSVCPKSNDDIGHESDDKVLAVDCNGLNSGPKSPEKSCPESNDDIGHESDDKVLAVDCNGLNSGPKSPEKSCPESNDDIGHESDDKVLAVDCNGLNSGPKSPEKSCPESNDDIGHESDDKVLAVDCNGLNSGPKSPEKSCPESNDDIGHESDDNVLAVDCNGLNSGPKSLEKSCPESNDDIGHESDDNVLAVDCNGLNSGPKSPKKSCPERNDDISLESDDKVFAVDCNVLNSGPKSPKKSCPESNDDIGHESDDKVLAVGVNHPNVSPICDVECGPKSPKKSAAKVDSKNGNISARSATLRLYTPERRPSAPAVMKDGHPSLAVRQQIKNKVQLNTVLQSKFSAASIKQTAQTIQTVRSSVDPGKSNGSRITNTAFNDPARLRVARAKTDADKQPASGNGLSQSSTSRQPGRSFGSKTQSGSQLNASKINASPPRTSSPVSGSHSRASVVSSQHASSVDLSSLDLSRNAVSQPLSSATSSVKSSPTELSASRRLGSHNTSLASQKLTAAVGALSSRTGVPATEPRNAGKGSLATKRSSVVDLSAKPGLHDNRRGSVTLATTIQSRQQLGPGSSNGNLKTSKVKPSCANIATPSQRPDVVSNLVIDDNSANKIAQLEVLCETKTRELSALKNELSEKIMWFEAMAIVVNFFVGQLQCEACKRLTNRLQNAADELKVSGTHLDELTKQRDALIDEIQNIKQFEEKQRENLQSVHEDALKKREIEINTACNDELQKVHADHTQNISQLESSFKEQLESWRESCNIELAEKECEFNEHMMELKLEHDNNLADLQRQHECQLEEITQRFELIKIALSERAEFLHTEGEELRKREKTYMETCQREFEMRIQSYNQLPQENESLKAVIELKNSELHDLRHHNMQLQREMDELPAARETIKRLKQQVENLDAIISIRADYEKQLTEKHQQLIRKYDQESKANKRLSMDKEELMWRLAQGDSMLETPRRSLSHSPTVAVDQVPDSARSRLPSNTLTVSERPLSAAVSLTPRLSSVVSSVKLRRSGTYDLLHRHEADEEVFD